MILNVKYIMFLNPQLQYRIKDTISGLKKQKHDAYC